MEIWERLRSNPALLKQGLEDPSAVVHELNRIYHQRRRGRYFNEGGTEVFEEDWDNLVILDACRYDEYVRATPFEGTPEMRVSRGSSSAQFVRGNFTGRTLHDVVYVSGNQWYMFLKDRLECELHRHYDVERDAVDGAVPSPETLTEAALKLAEEHPDKRLLIHYMQPHFPYLGTYGEKFNHEGKLRRTMERGRATRDELLIAYRDNLRLVLEQVHVLVDELDGKTVISADHGELLGERTSPLPIRWYGHPRAIYVDTLVTVPWHVVSDGPRKDIRPEPPTRDRDDVDAEDVERNLKNLGYL